MSHKRPPRYSANVRVTTLLYFSRGTYVKKKKKKKGGKIRPRSRLTCIFSNASCFSARGAMTAGLVRIDRVGVWAAAAGTGESMETMPKQMARRLLWIIYRRFIDGEGWRRGKCVGCHSLLRLGPTVLAHKVNVSFSFFYNAHNLIQHAN